MSFHTAFTQQIQAFQAAILDDCDRACRPDQTDAMALRLRANALALAKVQLALVALVQTGEPEPVTKPAEPDPPVAAAIDHGHQDRLLTGDALARFASSRLGSDESPHDVWQHLLDAETGKRARNAGLPGAGFRSSSG